MPSMQTNSVVVLVISSLGIYNFASGQQRNYSKDDIMNLRHALLGQYDKNFRPIINQSQAVTVNLSLYMMFIHSLDEASQKLSFSAWIYLVWYDEMLTWEPERYNNINRVVMNPDEIWKPDIGVSNSFNNMSSLECDDCFLELSADGRVAWGPGGVFSTRCLVDMTSYPFDTQNCNISFSTTASQASEIEISPQYLDLVDFKENVEWEILSTDLCRVHTKHGGRSKAKAGIATVHFTIRMSRRGSFHVFTVLVAVLFFSSLTVVGFILPSEAREKVSISASIFLSSSFFMAAWKESMPRQSRFAPILGIYITIIMVAGAASVGLSAFISSLWPRNDHQVASNDNPVTPRDGLSTAVEYIQAWEDDNETLDSPNEAKDGIIAEENKKIDMSKVSRLCNRICLWSSIVFTVCGATTTFVLLKISQ